MKALILAALLLLGCAHRPCEPTRTLYVVSHGWHSGIVVEGAALAKRFPQVDLGNYKYLEIGWGEERFYQARQPTLARALRALWPSASVLHVVAFDEPPLRYFAASEVAAVRTDDAGYAATLDFIAGTFTPGVTRLGPSLYGEGAFYRAEGTFHLFNTCSSWVAAALEKAACR
jgi:uncharacterized protein (TIGR02117 family)